MDYWPSYIPKPSSLSESVDDPYIEATSETGDDSARVRYSKERQGPTKLTWKIMRLGDFVALKQFYADHRAIEFLWLHPSRGLTYKTRFVSSPISSSEDGKSPFVAQVEVTLQIVELAPTEQEQPSASDLMDTINAGADKAVQAAIDAEQARDDAKEYAKKAAASAKEAADTAAEIPAAVEAGIERIEKAGASQISAVNSAGSTQVSKVNSAGTKQTTAVNNAGAAQVSKVNSAGTSQIAAVENAGSEQIAAVKAEGKAQTAAAKKQADAAAASAEEAAERLAEFKDLGAAAKTLAAGSKATASFDSSTGILTIGVPEGKKGDKGDPGTFSEDGVTVVANASGEAMAKDVAIGGDLGDLASARGIFDTLTKGSVDCNTLTEQGVYAISLAGTVNGPGFSAKLVVFNGKNSKLTNQMALAAGAGTSGAVRVAYRAKNSEDIWSPWSEGILSGRIGDGITVNNGIISAPEYEGATASSAGTSGLVPPAAAGQQESFLNGGGEYKPALTKISDSVNLADSKTAASATAVKAAYDRGTEALTVAEAALPKTGGDLSGQLTINGDSVARAGSNTKFNRIGYSSSPPLVWGGTHDDLINYNLYFTDQLRVYGANRAGSLCHSGNLDSAKTTTFIWDTSIETSWIAAFNSDGSNLHPVSSGSLSVYTSASLQGCVARVNGQPIGLAGTWLVIFVGNDFNIKTAVIDGGAIPATENKNYVAIRIQ